MEFRHSLHSRPKTFNAYSILGVLVTFVVFSTRAEGLGSDAALAIPKHGPVFVARLGIQEGNASLKISVGDSQKARDSLYGGLGFLAVMDRDRTVSTICSKIHAFQSWWRFCRNEAILDSELPIERYCSSGSLMSEQWYEYLLVALTSLFLNDIIISISIINAYQAYSLAWTSADICSDVSHIFRAQRASLRSRFCSASSPTSFVHVRWVEKLVITHR